MHPNKRPPQLFTFIVSSCFLSGTFAVKVKREEELVGCERRGLAQNGVYAISLISDEDNGCGFSGNYRLSKGVCQHQ